MTQPQAAPFHPGSTAQFPSGLEQRMHRRARASWAARLIDAAGIINTAQVCDVSEGGFGLMSDVRMPAGALLDIVLAVPKNKACDRSVPVRCQVRVVSCSFVGEHSRLSVQIVSLPKESRIAIRNYVISHC